MVRRYISEFGAKVGIYCITSVMLLCCLLFAQGARRYRAATPAAVSSAPAASSGLPGGAFLAPQAAESTPPANPGISSSDALSPPESAPAAEEETGIDFREIDAGALDTAFLNAEIARVAVLGVTLPHGSLYYIGPFHATAYCCEVYPHICGGNGVTASGTVPTPGLTVAADWDVLPAGTWLFIAGVGLRRVEDTGSAIKENRLDVAVDTHDNALRWPGFGRHDVWVIA